MFSIGQKVKTVSGEKGVIRKMRQVVSSGRFQYQVIEPETKCVPIMYRDSIWHPASKIKHLATN